MESRRRPGLAVLLVLWLSSLAGASQVEGRQESSSDRAELNRLGAELESLQVDGRFVEAAEVAAAIAQLQTKLDGSEHPDTKAIQLKVRDLGFVLLLDEERQVELASANQSFEQGCLLARRRICDQAVPCLQRALSIYDRLIPRDNGEAAAILHMLGFALNEMQRGHEAEPLLRRAIVLYERLLGPGHPFLREVVQALATALRESGELAEAELLQRKVLSSIRSGDANSFGLDKALHELGVTRWLQGNLNEAEELLRDALRIRQRELGAQHRKTLHTLSTLVGVLNGMGRNEEALPLIRQLVIAHRQTLGPNHADTLDSMGNLGLVLEEMEEYEEAEELYLEVLEKRRSLFGAGDRNVLRLQHNLANLWSYCGRVEEAEDLYLDTLDAVRSGFGVEDTEVFYLANELGLLCYRMARMDEAEEHWSYACRLLERLRLRAAYRGMDRASYLAFFIRRAPSGNLAALLARDGRFAEAWSRLEGAERGVYGTHLTARRTAVKIQSKENTSESS